MTMEENVQTEMPTTRSVGMLYGLIMAVVSIVYFIVLILAGVDMTSGFGRWFSTIFYIAIIYLAHKNFKDNGDGFLSFGQGMGITFWISIISSAIYSAFFYIYIKFLDSTFVEMIKEKQMEEMQAKGMQEEQIDQAMKMASMFMSPEVMSIFSVVFGVIFILIIGIFVTLFTQKKDPNAIV